MRVSTRIIIVIAALALSLTYFLPLWTISLAAPQYPEGLGFEIWINQMRGQNQGDLNKINNLNHYIGMKKITPESIVELKVMPWIMRGVMLLGLAVAIIGRRRWLTIWLIVFMAVAAAGFVDYYMWGYDYGHNLDTAHAIIKIPGMSYQPPLIGSKKLLNFTATSLPGSGGWAAIGSFLAGVAVWFYEGKRAKKAHGMSGAVKVASAMSIVFGGLLGCGQLQPATIQYGIDQCDYCRMTIADQSFGTEMATKTGKILKYDSIECLAAADWAMTQKSEHAAAYWVTEFGKPGHFMPVDDAVIVATDRQKSPMGVGLVAVATEADAQKLIASVGGKILPWPDVLTLVDQTWKLGAAK